MENLDAGAIEWRRSCSPGKTDALEALGAAEHFRADVVLLDIGLPKLNGYDVCRDIRRQPWGKDMVLVAVSGWGQNEDRHWSKEAGFDTHMVKPVGIESLLKLLASLPDGRAQGTAD